MKQPDAKTRILEAAKKLFAEQGFAATSVKQICVDAGVNISLVSYYFGGKENVLSALFKTYFLNSTLLFEKQVANDPIAGIRSIVSAIIRFRIENPEMMTILHREILNQSPRNSEIESYIFPLWNCLRFYLQDGREKGLFQFQSLDQVFQLVVSTIVFPRINPRFLQPLLADEHPDSSQLLEDTMGFIMGGLRYSPAEE